MKDIHIDNHQASIATILPVRKHAVAIDFEKRLWKRKQDRKLQRLSPDTTTDALEVRRVNENNKRKTTAYSEKAMKVTNIRL